jgi:polysaccharide export outer membrane protein
VLSAVCAAGAGCHTGHPGAQLCQSAIPRELSKMSLPTYRVEPPDILVVEAIRAVPRPPYHARPLDVLGIQVSGVEMVEPIAGYYQVSPEGTITLGTWGSINAVGLTLAEIKTAIEKFLKDVKKVTNPVANIFLERYSAIQQIRGEHLVRPDGTVGLGTYGDVHVSGMTLVEVREAIEARLSPTLQNPEISVDVLAYNSKLIWVIFDTGSSSEVISRQPATGNDTVLDIISKVGGLQPYSSSRRIWVARPGPACAPCDQIMPVDWEAIVRRGRTETNYQLMPGDRVYVSAQPLVMVDTTLARLFSPIERLFGITLLGQGLVRELGLPIHSNSGSGGSGGGGGF